MTEKDLPAYEKLLKTLMKLAANPEHALAVPLLTEAQIKLICILDCEYARQMREKRLADL